MRDVLKIPLELMKCTVLQTDAENALFGSFEETWGFYNCTCLTTICLVHILRSLWYNCKRRIKCKVAPSEARMTLYFLQVLVS
jgi:hypothetical protein